MKKTVTAEEINVKDAAKIAQVDGRTIRRWLHAGLIVGRQIGEGKTSAYLVSKQSLLQYLQTKGSQAAT